MKKKILTTDDFAIGFKDILEIAEDLCIDFPKLFDYLASILAKLILIDALNLDFLETEATQPLQAENKQKLINLVEKAIKSEENS